MMRGDINNLKNNSGSAVTLPTFDNSSMAPTSEVTLNMFNALKDLVKTN